MPPSGCVARLGGMARKTSIVGVLICVSLFVAACGGDELSKDDYIAQADEICEGAQERAEELPQPVDPGSAETYANGLEEITEEYVADLHALEPPSDDAKELGELIDNIEQAGLKIVEATRMQSTGANPAQPYSEALNLAEAANEQAEAYGFERCGISEILEHAD